MSAVIKKIEESIHDLPPRLQAEVVNFAEFLREKWKKQTENQSTITRVLGIYEGQGWISADFDEYLGDDFWLGEDFGLIEKEKNEPAA